MKSHSIKLLVGKARKEINIIRNLEKDSRKGQSEDSKCKGWIFTLAINHADYCNINGHGGYQQSRGGEIAQDGSFISGIQRVKIKT